MQRPSLTFRLKILLSLVAVVFLFLVVLSIVVGSETSHQINVMTKETRDRANRAFNELERLYHQELLRFTQRISETNRLQAALQAAVEEDDPQVLIESALYELKLAKIPLAVFTDEEGTPVVTLLDLKVQKEKIFDNRHLRMQQLLNNKSPHFSGYLEVAGGLYTTDSIVLKFFGEVVGTLTIGFPMDMELAMRMGNVIEAEIAFIKAGRVLSATDIQRYPGLETHLLGAAAQKEPVTVTVRDSLWVIVADPLMYGAGAADKGLRVMALSLERYLEPLNRIETVFRLAGLAVLLISILLGISISRGLAAPVKQLVNATQKVKQGDFQSRVTIKGKDELSILGESFNQMTEGLLLKEQYRGILDKVVSPEVAEEMVKGEIKLGGENREVTTLFADIRGFTSLTEDMEPQEVITMLNQYMEGAAEAVDQEGGVVDKYVGDEVMAIFGAPVSHKDDALRAVRAAIKIKENINMLNKKRETENLPPIRVGIGINTGLAVAGNMGSVNRLNYTVLGESVNIAARLCAQAKPGDILVSEQTYGKTNPHILGEQYDALPMKGVSKAVKVFRVRGYKRKAGQVMGMVMNMAAIVTMLLLWFISTGTVVAAEPGFSIISRKGDVQIDFSGRLALEGFLPQDAEPWLIYETGAFVSGKLSLFADIFLGKRLYGLIELRADRGEVPANNSIDIRLEQAFIRYTFLEGENLHLQMGKFVSPFGDYSQRHDTVADPFIRPPLLHEYRTMICPGNQPGNNDKFIDWKYVPHLFRPTGAPIIWGVPYQAGVMLFGSFGKFSFRAAAMNSAPSSDPVQWDLDFKQKWNYSWVAHVSWHISPELTVGASFDYGPYSLEELEYSSSYGNETEINDYNQIMWGFNVTYTKGRTAFRGELIYDTWQVPNVMDDPKDLSYYLEMMVKFFPGFYGALRYNGIHFNKISYYSGEKAQWDFNVQRWQAALGYRFSRRLEAKVEYMLNTDSSPKELKDNLLAIQIIWRF